MNCAVTLSPAEILAGPHLKSVMDTGDNAPVLIIEPLQFIGPRQIFETAYRPFLDAQRFDA